MKRALITGVAGQDGSYLAEFLAKKGYEVNGVGRDSSTVQPKLRRNLNNLWEIDLDQPAPLRGIVEKIRPDEIYHLAAHHFSAQGTENRIGDLKPFISVNLMAADVLLGVIKEKIPSCRFFYAGSAHIFGEPTVCPQTESTPFRPETPYAISKVTGVHLCRYYLQTLNVYTSVGILYNHESRLRGDSFITTQIARCAALAYLGNPEQLVIRNLDAVVDWGAAKDYVQAMWLTLQQASGGEYVISSGVQRTVMDFANMAFDCVNLNASDHITQDKNLAGGCKQKPYVGDSSKIRNICGWEPQTSFRELVKEMVDNQVVQLSGQPS